MSDMSEPRKIWIGDEWRNCDDGARAWNSRYAQQAKADMDYALGKISLTQWRAAFDRIGTLASDGSPLRAPSLMEANL